jgi:hypothetical protein
MFYAELSAPFPFPSVASSRTSGGARKARGQLIEADFDS